MDHRAALALIFVLFVTCVASASMKFLSGPVFVAEKRVRKHLKSDDVCSGAFERLWNIDALDLLDKSDIHVEEMRPGVAGKARSDGEVPTIRVATRVAANRDIKALEHIIIHELAHLASHEEGTGYLPFDGEIDTGSLIEVLCYGKSDLKSKLIRSNYCEERCRE